MITLGENVGRTLGGERWEGTLGEGGTGTLEDELWVVRVF